jgi:hypothetical protein
MSELTDTVKVTLYASGVQLNDIEVKFRRSAGDMPVPAALAPVAAMPAAPAAEVVPLSFDTSDATMDTDTEDTTLTLVPVNSMKVGLFRRCRCLPSRARF